MAEFLVELYAARSGGETIADDARAAADVISRSGTRVRCVSSIFVPDDETCFLLYEADTLEAVERATALAGLTYERVLPAHATGAVKH